MAGFEEVEENLRATLAVFGRATSAGETREFPGVAVTSSGIQFSMFNSALLTSPVRNTEELEHRIHTARAFFAARNLAWSFWICQDWIDRDVRGRIGALFGHNAMHLVVELPAMAVDRLARPSRELPKLTIEHVSSASTRTDFNHIMVIAFGIPMPISRAVYESEHTWNGEFLGYVGYLDGLPVSSTAVMVTRSVTGVYAVGTLPQYQHKGYAEAIMRYALAEARESAGIERSILQSSEAGFSLYRRMGYRTVTRYAVFGT